MVLLSKKHEEILRDPKTYILIINDTIRHRYLVC